MFHHILVPLDGSPRAEQALPTAARFAHASGGTLTLLTVVAPVLEIVIKPVRLTGHAELPLDTEIAQANEYLAGVASSGDLKGIEVRTDVMTGIPASIILLFAQLQHVDLIVMCSHGFTGFTRWRLGGIAQHVARQSPVPVFVLCEGGSMLTQREDTTHPLRVLVALDGSPLAEAALLPAAQLCASLAAPARGALHLTRVLPFPELEDESQKEMLLAARKQAEADVTAYLDTVKQRLREGDLAQLDLMVTSSVVVHTDVADTLIRVAEHGEFIRDIEGFAGCDVIAMATHGRSGPQRWVMGSITERMLGATRLPLLIVRSHQPPAEEQTGAAEAAKMVKGVNSMKLNEILKNCLWALDNRYPDSVVTINKAVLRHRSFSASTYSPVHMVELLQIHDPQILDAPACLVINAQECSIYLLEHSEEIPAFWISCEEGAS